MASVLDTCRLTLLKRPIATLEILPAWSGNTFISSRATSECCVTRYGMCLTGCPTLAPFSKRWHLTGSADTSKNSPAAELLLIHAQSYFWFLRDPLPRLPDRGGTTLQTIATICASCIMRSQARCWLERLSVGPLT